MKNINDVLQQKEVELARVRREIDAMRLVVPLLMDEKDQPASGGQWSLITPKSTQVEASGIVMES